MSSDVAKQVKESTSRCPNKFECLENDNFQLCTVIDFIRNENLLFVDGKFNQPCPYMLPFADSCICSCPVRIELYRKFKR